jgi:hypothetical protein
MKTTGYVRFALILSLAVGVLMILSSTGARTQHAEQFRDPIVPNRANAKSTLRPDQQRIVPQSTAATFTVTRADDIPERGTCAVGDCTLREAIIASNNTAGTDTINFSAGLNGVPITLTQTGVDPAEDFADYGDLDIRDSVIIAGNGTANTIIQAGATAFGGIDKIFGINPDCSGAGPSVAVTINDLTLRNGHNAGVFNAVQFNHTGGAIDFCGGGSGTNALTMSNVIVLDNQVDQGSGGGLNVSGVSTGTTNINLTSVQFLNNKTIDNNHVSSGAGASITLNTSATSMTVNITNCTFDNNEAQNSSGGGLQIVSNITAVNTGVLNIHHSVFNNNRAKGGGGGIDLVSTSGANGKIAATIDQETVISNNVTGFNSGTAFGGGIHLELVHANASVNLSKVTIINNSDNAGAVTKLGGGGIAVGTAGAGVSIQFSRIAGNTISGGVGSGLRKDNQAGSVTAMNNWWGCSAGPIAAPCDTAVLVAGSGSLTTSPFLRIKTTPTTNPILVNQSSLMTARAQNSSGIDTAVSNLDVFVNTNTAAGSPLTINWSSVGGTLSGQQTTLQSSGGFAQATATYLATAANANNSATAKIDNDTTTGNSNTGLITVNKADTSVVINSDNPDPSLIGTAITVNYTFSITNAPSSPTVPSGNISISDGVDTVGTCSASLGTNNCTITLNTSGARTLTATYAGDSNFNGSSDTEPHVVIAPDFTATKTNNVSNSTFLGNSWTWTISITNTGTAAGSFTSGQTILSDNLPNTNISYGPTSISNVVNVTNGANINCAIAGNNLSCSASGATVTIGATTGRFDVSFTATPTPIQAAAGAIANPRSGGICSVDPNSNVLESGEGNNGCSNTVTVTAITPVFTDPAGVCSGNTPCFTSIQTAIDVVAAAGTVNVGPGNYGESPNLNRTVTINVNGNINIGGLTFSSGTINGGSSIVSVTGDWTNNGGAFNGGSGSVNFNGSALQTIGGSASTTFSGLTNNNAASISMANDTTVNGVLALTGGDITVVAGKTLIQPPATLSTGTLFDVIGDVRRTNGASQLPSGTPITFGNENNIITFAAGGTLPTDITVNLVKSAPSGAIGFPTAVQRTYTITPSAFSGISATLRLHYLDSELNGNTEGAGLFLWRFNGVAWKSQGQTGNDTATNWVEKSGVTDFSPWTFNSTLFPSASNGTLSGRITNADGSGVAGAVVNLSGTQTRKTITDADGNYQFNDVETNGFYTVTPSRANYDFNPFNRSLNVLADRTEASFTGMWTGDSLNPLDTPEFFVRQQYVDVLGREPDEGGFNYWSNQILACNGDVDCTRRRRVSVAAAFFIEDEFQTSGSYLYSLYSLALERQPRYIEYGVDRTHIVAGSNLAEAKRTFTENFVQRPEFLAKFNSQLSAESFVDALLANARASGSELDALRDNLIAIYGSGGSLAQHRAAALLALADNATIRQANYNSAFVITEYFGYLQRDPDRAGFEYWLNVLNNRESGNYRGMVCAFITSTEYQRRFSQVITRSNADCGH